jgi:lysophospholipid acyltransferase (LPLAT)-like uncharacterized protein
MVLTLVAVFILLLTLSSPFAKSFAQTTASATVARMWHGRVPVAKAEEYTTYINEAGLKKIRTVPSELREYAKRG